MFKFELVITYKRSLICWHSACVPSSFLNRFWCFVYLSMPPGVFRVDAPEPPQIHVWQLEGFLFETITRHRYVVRLTPRYGVTCGVEKEYLAWPITKRSLVRVQPPQQT